jgi:hypothetical protein
VHFIRIICRYPKGQSRGAILNNTWNFSKYRNQQSEIAIQ